MVNKRLVELAKRLGRDELPKEEVPKVEEKPTIQPSISGEPFILCYDEFGKELVRKNNERFGGTDAEIPVGGLKANEEIPYMNMTKRAGLITTMSLDEQLRSLNTWPITPYESEVFLKQGKLPHLEKNWEDLALILYDKKGVNQKELEAFRESYRFVTGSELGDKVLIIDPGLTKDSDIPHGVKFMFLPGVTDVYYHEKTLSKTGQNHKFEYGLEHGLPDVNELGKGKRTLYMPSGDNLGLRVLYRDRGLGLYARVGRLACSDADGRVVLARRA